MTEEEANTKECCRDRSVDCVGSACMAWREIVINRAVRPADGSELPYAEGWRIVRSLDPAGANPRIEWKRVDGFYCGLAGVPQ